MVAACIGIALDVVQYGSQTLGRGLFTLTLLQSWIPDEAYAYAGNSVGWSLSTEVFFYALFPLLIKPVSGLSRRGLGVLLCLVLGTSVAWQFALRGDYSDVASWAAYIAPPYRALEFVAGMCLARLLMAGVRLRLPVFVPVVLTISALLAGGHFKPGLMATVAIPVIPFCLLIFAVAEADLENRRTGLRHSLLIRLGQWSYAFYLVHQLVTRTLTDLLEHETHAPTLFAAYAASYVLATFGAYLLFRFVERPLEQRIRAGAPAAIAVRDRAIRRRAGRS